MRAFTCNLTFKKIVEAGADFSDCETLGCPLSRCLQPVKLDLSIESNGFFSHLADLPLFDANERNDDFLDRDATMSHERVTLPDEGLAAWSDQREVVLR